MKKTMELSKEQREKWERQRGIEAMLRHSRMFFRPGMHQEVEPSRRPNIRQYVHLREMQGQGEVLRQHFLLRR